MVNVVRWTRVVVVAFLLGPVAGDAQPAAPPTMTFSFVAFGNNVRVLPPLVGEWQLGTAILTGSGSIKNGTVVGAVLDRDNPPNPKYPPRSMQADIIGARFEQEGSTRRLFLTIRIKTSSHPQQNCAPGMTGTLELQDSPELMPNGKTFDYAILDGWSGDCPSHTHGWNNTDGGERTSPPYGGPPDGGQRADVEFTMTGQPTTSARFKIDRVEAPASVNRGSTSPIRIHWSGNAPGAITFWINTCVNTCSPTEYTFAVDGNSYSMDSAIVCSGTFPANSTMRYSVSLRDASGRIAQPVEGTVICR